ncbi:MAG: hybrid sensor histidine kinase/response regulator [Bacteroidaceae bacterium]|jgi:signal transduction histidine kinase/CheY-like chemotaxis protein
MPAIPSRFTRLKVFLGYASLLALLLVALLYIHQEMENLEAIDQEQLLNSDSLYALIREKDHKMLTFLQESNRQKGLTLSEKELKKLLEPSPQPVRKQVVIHQDSIVHREKPKSFFKRVAEVFSPTKDSALQIGTRVEITIDTLQTPAANDSLKESIGKSIKQNQSALSSLRKKQESIRRNEQILNSRIDSIISQYETKANEQIQKFNLKQQTLRNKSVRAIATIAVSALLLAAIFLIIICRDLARNKRYRIQLEEARRHAEELLHAREQMMLAITHDFKAPLGNIMGYAELLDEQLAGKAPQENVRHIQNSAQHLMELIKKLLNFHRLEQKKTELVATPFSPLHFFEEIAADFRPTAQARNLALHTDFSDLPTAGYETDTVQLRQLIDNLMSNALKFTDHGSITLRARMQNHWLRFSVADTGSGIDEADRERIFHAFTRLPGAQGREGFGLGLSIVHELISLFQGEIQIESRKGEGTTFTVLLPLNPSTARPQTTDGTENATPQNEKTLEGIRFLIIDDDRIQLRLTQERFSRRGATADCCVTPEELIERLRNARYDFILTDVQMPAMSGFELLELLRASNLPGAKDTPIIAVTAREMDEKEFTDKGFAGCLHKPYSAHEVVQLVERIRSQSKPQDNTEKVPALSAESGGTSGEKSRDFSDSPTGKPDWSGLTGFCGDDENEKKELLELFQSETLRELELLEKAQKEGDMQAIAAIAHKQLPVFQLIRADECAQLMCDLQQPGKTFSPEAKAQTERLIAAEKEILHLLQTELL